MNKLIFNKIILSVLCLGFLLVLPYTTEANSKSKPRLKEIKFSRLTNDKGAVFKAKDLYSRYWGQFNVKLPKNAPVFAQSISFKQGKSKKDFLIMQSKTGLGGECVRLGCEITIFEDYGNNKWRMILHAFSHDVFISNKKTDGYYDLHLASNFKSGEKNRDGIGKVRFFWTGNKYMSQKQVDEKK